MTRLMRLPDINVQLHSLADRSHPQHPVPLLVMQRKFEQTKLLSTSEVWFQINRRTIAIVHTGRPTRVILCLQELELEEKKAVLSQR